MTGGGVVRRDTLREADRVDALAREIDPDAFDGSRRGMKRRYAARCMAADRLSRDAVPDVPPTDPVLSLMSVPDDQDDDYRDLYIDDDDEAVVPPDPPAEMFAKRFPKWLSEHDADVKAQALEDAADEIEAELDEFRPRRISARWVIERLRAVSEREGGRP